MIFMSVRHGRQWAAAGANPPDCAFFSSRKIGEFVSAAIFFSTFQFRIMVYFQESL